MKGEVREGGGKEEELAQKGVWVAPEMQLPHKHYWLAIWLAWISQKQVTETNAASKSSLAYSNI